MSEPCAMVVAHAARLAQEAEGASEESGESAAKIVSDVRLPPNLDLHQGVP